MRNVTVILPAYNKFYLEQLTELLTWYGKIDEVWFDGAIGASLRRQEAGL